MLDGLPVGLQFVGDAWDEASVIAALAHVERLELSELPAPAATPSSPRARSQPQSSRAAAASVPPQADRR